MLFPKSAELFATAKKIMPGGVNSPVRAFQSVGMEPLFISKAKGAHIYDADQNQYVDYVGSWGPMILGHADERVLKTLTTVASQGLSFGAPSEHEIELAKLVLDFYPSMEMVRMVNSGTEAVMGAVRLARGYSGKSKIIKFAGCYHGHADYLLAKSGSGLATLGIPDSLGVPKSLTQDTFIVDYNDLDQLQKTIKQHPNEIAAMIVEPIAGNMGMVMPGELFLRSLRILCDQQGILLIFDEVMTGFRVAKGGCVELYQVKPDLVVLGKIIGGGLPVGAYLSSRKIMENVSPIGKVYQAGTLSGNPLAMAVGTVTLQALNKENFYPELQSKANFLKLKMSQIAQNYGLAFQMQAVGGMLGLFFLKDPVKNYEQAQKLDRNFYAEFFKAMLMEGIYLPPSAFEAWFLSTAHQPEDLEKTVFAFEKSLSKLSKAGIFPAFN